MSPEAGLDGETGPCPTRTGIPREAPRAMDDEVPDAGDAREAERGRSLAIPCEPKKTGRILRAFLMATGDWNGYC